MLFIQEEQSLGQSLSVRLLHFELCLLVPSSQLNQKGRILLTLCNLEENMTNPPTQDVVRCLLCVVQQKNKV